MGMGIRVMIAVIYDHIRASRTKIRNRIVGIDGRPPRHGNKADSRSPNTDGSTGMIEMDGQSGGLGFK